MQDGRRPHPFYPLTEHVPGRDGQHRTAWEPPAVKDCRAGLRALPPSVEVAPAPPEGRKVNLLSAGGARNNCDVWINVPSDWSDVTLGLYASLRETSVLLDLRRGDPLAPADRPTGTGRFNGVAFAIRGRVADVYTLVAWQPAGSDRADGFFVMQVWGHEGPPGDRAARLIHDVWAHPWQQVSFPNVDTGGRNPLANGANLVLGANPTGGRTQITRLTATNNRGGTQTLELQERGGTAGTVTRAQWHLFDDTTLVEEWTYPLRSSRGAEWHLVLSGGAPAILANVQGYHE